MSNEGLELIMKKNENGSALAVVSIIVVVSIIAILGYVVWQKVTSQQNIAQPNSPTEAAPDTPNPSVSASFNPAFGASTSFEYPSDWKIERTLTGPTPIDESGKDFTKELLRLISPSGNYSISYVMYSHGGVGGTCDPNDTPFKVAQSNATKLNNFQNVSLSQLVIKNDTSNTYSYDVGLKRTRSTQEWSASLPICQSSISLAGLFATENGRMLGVTTNIKTLDDAEGNSLELNSLDEITKAFETKEYAELKSILLSTKSVLEE